MITNTDEYLYPMLKFEGACLLKAGKWSGSQNRQNFLQISDPIKLKSISHLCDFSMRYGNTSCSTCKLHTWKLGCVNEQTVYTVNINYNYYEGKRMTTNKYYNYLPYTLLILVMRYLHEQMPILMLRNHYLIYLLICLLIFIQLVLSQTYEVASYKVQNAGIQFNVKRIRCVTKTLIICPTHAYFYTVS